MIERIFAIARKEFYQIWRDKRSLGMLAFVPTFTILLFGFALSFDTKHIKLAVADLDQTNQSRQFVQSFLHSEYFDLVTEIPSTVVGQKMIEAGTADVVVVIPVDFSKKMIGGESVDIQALVNGGNSNVATTAANYVGIFAQSYSSLIRTAAMQKIGRAAYIPVDYRPRIWFNPELKSSKYLVPGLMGYVMIISTVLSTALSIVREKERGTIEQMMVSPVSSREFMIGKTVPYFVIACVLATLIIMAGWLLFDIPVKGSIPILALALLFFIIGGLGMGLAISTLASTQESAFFLATFATVLPTQLLSGFIFPIENMPVVLKAITTIVPAKYLLIVLRGILLKGSPITAYWQAFAALVIFAFLTMTLAIRRLKKTV
ncbi:MAG: ABC-type multidrug transport system permease component [Chlorobi bacterium]|nr:ABC-type multidrug transport system permease component [Chlorobiota bacterium]